MKIEVGKTYRNRGAGRTQRTVLGIGDEYQPEQWHSMSDPPNEPGVWYVDNHGKKGRLYLSSFKQWAGSEVKK